MGYNDDPPEILVEQQAEIESLEEQNSELMAEVLELRGKPLARGPVVCPHCGGRLMKTVTLMVKAPFFYWSFNKQGLRNKDVEILYLGSRSDQSIFCERCGIGYMLLGEWFDEFNRRVINDNKFSHAIHHNQEWSDSDWPQGDLNDRKHR